MNRMDMHGFLKRATIGEIYGALPHVDMRPPG
jgi:hypothetical protein